MDSRQCVLAAVDLTADSQAVVSSAAGICKIRDKRLHLIHVVDHRLVRRLAELRQRPLAEARREALTRGRQALARLLKEADAPLDSRLHLAIGDPVPGILACVARLRPALLVLGESGLLDSAVQMEPVLTNGALGSETRVLLVSEGYRDGDPVVAARGVSMIPWSDSI